MIVGLTVLFLGIDIISKQIISHVFSVFDSVKVIPHFFSITYVKNTGAAWSILAGKRWLLLLVSFLIIVFFLLYIRKNKNATLLEKIGYSMILGGAIGNFLDRAIYGYVIDFLDFSIFGYDYPIFNLADSFIFIGVFLLILTMWGCKNGNKSSR